MTQTLIKHTIQSVYPQAEIHILDPQHDGVHLQALVIDISFQTLPLLEQHRSIMQALEKAFETTLHALGLKTFTPHQWENQKENYNLNTEVDV